MNPRLRETVLGIVDTQLKGGDPPIVKATYDRLRRMGYSDQQARLFIAQALTEEIYWVLETQQPHDPDRYAAALNRLPDTD